MKRLWIFALALSLAAAAFGQSQVTADWEPVLIPVYIDQTLPGANNALWRTNLWIQNGGNQNLAIAPWVCSLPPGVCLTTFPTATGLTPGQSLHTRVFSQSEVVSDTPLAEATLTAVSADSGDFHVTPAYAAYAIDINFGPVLLARDAAVRVEVTPLTAGSRYWAFVSATNNTTNHVTLVTPQ